MAGCTYACFWTLCNYALRYLHLPATEIMLASCVVTRSPANAAWTTYAQLDRTASYGLCPVGNVGSYIAGLGLNGNDRTTHMSVTHATRTAGRTSAECVYIEPTRRRTKLIAWYQPLAGDLPSCLGNGYPACVCYNGGDAREPANRRHERGQLSGKKLAPANLPPCRTPLRCPPRGIERQHVERPSPGLEA